MMQVMGLFPTPIAVSTYGGDVDYDFINSLQKESNDSNSISTDRSVLNDSRMTELNSFILEQIKQFVDIVYKPVNELEIYITQSWVNYTKNGESHHLHNHPNSLISGVFYVNANDTIEFVNVNGGIDIQAREIDVLNARSWAVPTSANKLVIFPSSLWHKVPKSTSNETRISIAFNVFVKGDISKDSLSLLELRL